MKRDLLAAITANRQIFWMCRSCTTLLSDLRHRKSVLSAFESGQESLLSTHNRIVEELKGEILTELRTELRTNFTALINSNSLTPKSCQRRTGNALDPKKRRLFGASVAPDQQAQPTMLGTGKPVSPGLCTTFVAAPTSKFWLYITRVSRNVTVEQVLKIATERLETEDVEITRLVAKDKDISTMSFISFKIGMDMALKQKALSSSTWPPGLTFREFVDRPRGNFWEPPTVQETDGHTTPPNPNISVDQGAAENQNVVKNPVLIPESMEE